MGHPTMQENDTAKLTPTAVYIQGASPGRNMESENESNRIKKYLDPSQSIYNAPWNPVSFSFGYCHQIITRLYKWK